MLSSPLVKNGQFTLLILLFNLSSGFGQNVLLFTIDSCRADRFGCYGYSKSPTPHIDAWSRTGVLFKNAYSTSAWTAPGLVSILTGLYPPTHDINNRDHMGSPGLLTLIKIFQKRGYEVPSLNFFTFAPYYRNLGVPDTDHTYFGPLPGDKLINWLEKNAGVPDAKPMFLWYHTTLVHQPYNPPPELLPASKEDLQKSAGIKAVMTGAIVPRGSTKFVEEDRAILDHLYDAELSRVDRLFKRAVDILSQKHLLEKTLIILTADHGEELLDHGFVGHASTSLQAKLYEEIVRIPLILSWPEKVPTDQIISHRVNQTDIFPTILTLFSIEIPGYIQGHDLLSLSGDRPLFFESVMAGNQTTKEREKEWVRAILEGDYKYISTGELYNLRTTPKETENIAKAKPEISRRLRGKLENWHRQTTALRDKVFPTGPQIYLAAKDSGCPRIFTPENGKTLDYDVHTGMILFDWSGDKETSYIIEYDIGIGDYHVAGSYEVRGNHQLLGPLHLELWGNLKAWNPFKIRVSPKADQECWSDWTVFHF